MAAEWEAFYNKFITYGGWRVVLRGLGVTARIAGVGLLIGVVIGTIIATVKMIPKYRVAPRIFSAIGDIYVGFFRGTPLVVQLLIGYFVLIPALGLHVDNVTTACIIFGQWTKGSWKRRGL